MGRREALGPCGTTGVRWAKAVLRREAAEGGVALAGAVVPPGQEARKQDGVACC